jgi:hypothetical protein
LSTWNLKGLEKGLTFLQSVVIFSAVFNEFLLMVEFIEIPSLSINSIPYLEESRLFTTII